MNNRSKLIMALAMFIFGTIGIFRRFIPWPSTVLAGFRGIVGAILLVVVFAIMNSKKANKNNVTDNDSMENKSRGKRYMPADMKGKLLLFLSGALIGFNWVLLFESYNYTSVATATLCYYMAPVFVVVASPFVFKKKLSVKSAICVAIAFVGMILVSGITDAYFNPLAEGKGVVFGLMAALLYSIVVILNKKIGEMDSFVKTIIQLGIAGIVTVPFAFARGEYANLDFDFRIIVYLLVVCFVNTGLAYSLYFATLPKLDTTTIALFSYIDPIVAVILSATILKETLTVSMIVGAVLILGAMLFDELSSKNS